LTERTGQCNDFSVPLPPTFDARLVRARKLSPSVRELVLERTDGEPFTFEAGQWVSLVLPQDEGDLRRAYSIASEPNGSPQFDLAVTHVESGPGSSYLHTIEPGAPLKAIGPQGFFTRSLESGGSASGAGGPALFIATGTGITPFRSMLRAALATGDTVTPLWLLFGVRHEEDILYRDELEAIAAEHKHVRLDITLSQPKGDWKGLRGYVQTHVRDLWHELAMADQRPAHAYICGLQKMVGSVRDLLRKEIKVPRERVHSERYD
jgi:ferredoxin-NADP reductase